MIDIHSTNKRISKTGWKLVRKGACFHFTSPGGQVIKSKSFTECLLNKTFIEDLEYANKMEVVEHLKKYTRGELMSMTAEQMLQILPGWELSKRENEWSLREDKNIISDVSLNVLFYKTAKFIIKHYTKICNNY